MINGESYDGEYCQMKKAKGVVIWFLKCFVAGIAAVGILSVFSLFYYNHGIRKTSESGCDRLLLGKQVSFCWLRRFCMGDE